MARMSPWIFAGVGCLGVAALGVVGIGGLGLLVSKSVTEEMSKPLDKDAVLAKLKLPIHPKAQWDEDLTKSMRAGSVVASKFAKLEMVTASFRLSAPQAEVKDWYKKALIEKGYVFKSETQEKATTLQFSDKDDMITVSLAEPAMLMLSRMKVPGR